MLDRIRVALNRPDPTYDRRVAWHQPSRPVVAHGLITFGLADWVGSSLRGLL